MMGNDDLKAETSVNKEIGLEWKHDGWQAGVTWFRNDYRDKMKRAMRQSAIPLQVKCKPISTSGKTCRRPW
ncbi:outer membrane receptor FepA [Citrobacter koseri]|uniref:Outer membrane receptor FepA n=1 Tax=Citrobacter koseri TaxID=545 RepID=A0A2X2UYF9_CITKO|nr:outer membrane receptor FepA [Citrobacter koseri]